jgi:hypothetical protein
MHAQPRPEPEPVPGVALERVIETLLRVGQLMDDLPQVAEVDVNPLIVGPSGTGAWAVDVRVVIENRTN